MGGLQAYSELEAVPQQRVLSTSLQDKSLPTDLGKQVVPDDVKQSIGESGQIETLGKSGCYKHDGNHQHYQHRPPRRKNWLLLVGAVALIVVLAAVLGGVFGLRHRSPKEKSLMNATNSPGTSPSATPSQRNIGASSYVSGSVNNSRLDFQDNVGQIVEAASSAQNRTWGLRRTHYIGKIGSAIAVAVSRPGFPLVT
ncbi:hypothetical protein ACLMJK_008489 [Lecanora helva]